MSLTAAIGLHAVLFGVPVRQIQSGPATSSVTNALSVRLSTSALGATNAGNEPSVHSAGVGSLPAADSADAPSGPPVSQPKAPERPPASPSPPVSPFGLFASPQPGDADYFTRDQLSVGPSPTSDVFIDYPPIDMQGGNHVSELSLFIDEEGKVVRVRVDGPALPAPLEDAARSAFMSARFNPGQVDGLPVRSRIRVEVSFVAAPVGR